MEEGSLCTEVNCVCTLKRQGPGRCANRLAQHLFKDFGHTKSPCRQTGVR